MEYVSFVSQPHSFADLNKEEKNMNWQKDRRELFLRTAEMFGIPYSERTGEQENLTRAGICWAIKGLTSSIKVYRWAADMTDFHWWGTTRGFGSWTPSHDNERSLFCCLMADLSDKEFEELQA